MKQKFLSVALIAVFSAALPGLATEPPFDLYNLAADHTRGQEASLRVQLFAVSPEAKHTSKFGWLKASNMERQTNSCGPSAVLAEDEFRRATRELVATEGVEALENCALFITNGSAGEYQFSTTNADGMVFDKDFRLEAKLVGKSGANRIDFEITPTWSVGLNTNSWVAPGPIYVGNSPLTTLSRVMPPGRVRAMTFKGSVLNGQTAVFANIRDGFRLHLGEGKELDAAFSTSDTNELIVFVTAVQNESAGIDELKARVWQAIQSKNAAKFVDCYFVESRFNTREARERNEKKVASLLGEDITQIEIRDIPAGEFDEVRKIQNSQSSTGLGYSLLPRKMLWVRYRTEHGTGGNGFLIGEREGKWYIVTMAGQTT